MFWLGAAAVSYLTMSVGSVLIWFPSENNKKRKENSNIVQRLTAAERSGMFLMWHWGILRSRTTGAEGEAVCSFGQRDFFFFWFVWCCGSHACKYSGCTRATLRNSLAWVSGHCISHQLMGTIWAPRTQKRQWAEAEKLSRNSSGSAFSNCVTHLFFCFLKMQQHPRVFTEGFTVVCGSAVESFRERRLPYPIHCAPPPPPARSLLSLAGNWTARHRERSDVTGQASTTETQAFNLHRSCNDLTHTGHSSHSFRPD